MADRGKQFEEEFKKDWKESMPDSFCYRLHDQTSGYKIVSRNPCDFICYKFPYLYLLEIKSHEGNTFPFSAFRQYEEMIKYKDITGAMVGVILWMVDHEKVLYIPIETFIKLKEEDKKSYNIKMFGDENYPAYEIPSVKKRTFLTSDYLVLEEIANEKFKRN